MGTADGPPGATDLGPPGATADGALATSVVGPPVATVLGPPGATADGALATTVESRPDPGPAATRGRPPGPARPGHLDQATPVGIAVALGVFALCVADLPRLATSVWAPKFAVLLVMGAAGIPVLLLRAFGRRGQSSGTELRARGSRTERRARGSRTERRAARFAVAFVLAGVVSMAGAARPLLALVGLYEQGTGWLFVMALAGCWALGTYLRAPDRDLVATALIGGALVNAVVSILQQATDLSSVGLGGFPNGTAPALPDGLLGNPSYSGALLAAALALIAPRFLAQPRRWAVPAAVIGVGLGVGGERLPALVALAVCLVVVWIARTHTAASVPAGESDRVDLSSRMLRSVLFSVPSLGGVIVGSIVARTSGGVGVVSHAAQSTANETFGQRFHAWSAALHAIGHSVGSHLAFGYGPGQFRAATSAYFSVSFERSSGVTFTDAHNLFVEYLTTTGIVGVVLLVCWLGCTVIPARGPMLGFALAILAVEMAEPLNVAITPLAFLALGIALSVGRERAQAIAAAPVEAAPVAAAPVEGAPVGGAPVAAAPVEGAPVEEAPVGGGPVGGGGPGGYAVSTVRRIGLASIVLALLAVIPASALVVGDVALARGNSNYQVAQDAAALRDAGDANTLLAPWPEPASQLAQVHYYEALGYVHGQSKLAQQWARTAVDRDPTNAALWTTLAAYQLNGKNLSGASSSAQQALDHAPWFAPAMTILGTVAAKEGHRAVARSWFERSLTADPGQPSVRKALRGL